MIYFSVEKFYFWFKIMYILFYLTHATDDYLKKIVHQ